MIQIKSQLISFGAIVASIAGALSANAGIIVTNNEFAFAALIANQAGSTSSEGFGAYEGYYDSGLSGGSGASAWTASAVNGLHASGGVISTYVPVSGLTLTFADSSVFAIGGDFFLTDFNFGSVAGLIVVTSNDVSYVYATTGVANSFAGFVSTSGSIQSISITPLTSGTFASTDSVTVGFVPAPGVAGLVAIAGLIRRRRRD